MYIKLVFISIRLNTLHISFGFLFFFWRGAVRKRAQTIFNSQFLSYPINSFIISFPFEH